MCILTDIEALKKRLDATEKKLVSIRPTNDKPRLAGAIYFASFTAIFIAGLFLNWHWGWLTAIAVLGVCSAASATDGTL